MDMFLSYSKIECMFMSWISEDYPLHRLLSDLRDIAISKIINPFFFFCNPLTSIPYANECHRI